MRRLSFLCILIFPFAHEAAAIIVTSGDGSGNTTAPADDPGWAHVTPSGVHIGSGWYLTANHLLVSGAIQLQNPASIVGTIDSNGNTVSQFADLAVYQDIDLGMPTFTVACSLPPVGTDVLMIGDGRDRATSLTTWNASWVEGGSPTAFTGYKWLTTATKRWGENSLTDNDALIKINSTHTISLETTFDQSGLTHEGQAASGDSGSGMFAKTGGNWELIGINYAIGNFIGQPESAVFDNKTFASDLTSYRTQIETITGTNLPCATAIPEPSSAIYVLVLGIPVGLVRHRKRLFRALPCL